MEKVVIVVKNGRVEEVYAAIPNHFEIEVIDLDFNGSDLEKELITTERLQVIQQYLCKQEF